jgi:hypothetical protein
MALAQEPKGRFVGQGVGYRCMGFYRRIFAGGGWRRLVGVRRRWFLVDVLTLHGVSPGRVAAFAVGAGHMPFQVMAKGGGAHIS